MDKEEERSIGRFKESFLGRFKRHNYLILYVIFDAIQLLCFLAIPARVILSVGRKPEVEWISGGYVF